MNSKQDHVIKYHSIDVVIPPTTETQIATFEAMKILFNDYFYVVPPYRHSSNPSLRQHTTITDPIF